MCTNAEQGKGGYDVFTSISFECSFQNKKTSKGTGTSLMSSATQNYDINE
jgi:hypothetical protein